MLVKLTPGGDLTNVLWAAFTCKDPKSIKRESSHQYLFALLGSACIKSFLYEILVPKNFKPKIQLCNFWRQNFVLKTCARKSLMKLTPGIPYVTNAKYFADKVWRHLLWSDDDPTLFMFQIHRYDNPFNELDHGSGSNKSGEIRSENNINPR